MRKMHLKITRYDYSPNTLAKIKSLTPPVLARLWINGNFLPTVCESLNRYNHF